MTGLAQRVDPHRAGALLSHRHLGHVAAVGQRERHPAALVERVRGRDVGALVHDPVHADVGRAVLLVVDLGEHVEQALAHVDVVRADELARERRLVALPLGGDGVD